MDSKKLLLVGILLIAAGGAFVYLDPLDLDLLGLKQKPAAVPHVPTPVAKPAVVPRAVVATAQTKASIAVPSPAPAASPAPKAAVAPTQANKSEGATAAAPSQCVSPPVATPPVEASAQAPQPPMKLSKTTKPASEPVRPKNQDLRYCLDLESDAAIAKCAGE
jgi:hypothetical protein